ncbi:hypothetical protein AZE42_02147 [Rhizopogon vesiculosus]|uniref:Uncharacterized protein n=1 Tax=Rhizopogon vesiculosus TaxID=180088 RepID=A0A1J8QGR6_9AGAM|nr:hypothetical protein AZE42_02147 [Rhizopogon vesiculosus]
MGGSASRCAKGHRN